MQVVDALAKDVDSGQEPKHLFVDAVTLWRRGKARPPAPAEHQTYPRPPGPSHGSLLLGANVQIKLGGSHAPALHERF